MQCVPVKPFGASADAADFAADGAAALATAAPGPYSDDTCKKCGDRMPGALGSGWGSEWLACSRAWRESSGESSDADSQQDGNTDYARPLCQRCRVHRPGRRRLCPHCRRYVGPGCLPPGGPCWDGTNESCIDCAPRPVGMEQRPADATPIAQPPPPLLPDAHDEDALR